MYINWFGCDVYPGGAYALSPSVAHTLPPLSTSSTTDNANTGFFVDDQGGGVAAVYTGYDDDDKNDGSSADEWPVMQQTEFGQYAAFVCGRPRARPSVAFFYFFSFTLLGAFVILSLLMGVVTIAMQNAMTGLHTKNLRRQRDEKLGRQWRQNPIVYTRYLYGGRSGKQLQYDAGGFPMTQLLKPVMGRSKAGAGDGGSGWRARRRQEMTEEREQRQQALDLASGRTLPTSARSHRKKHGSIVDEGEFQSGLETPLRATLKHLMKVAIRGRLEVKAEHMPGASARVGMGGGGGGGGKGIYGTSQKQPSLLSVWYMQASNRCQTFLAGPAYTSSFVVFICT
jgi:hypothetical protein